MNRTFPLLAVAIVSAATLSACSSPQPESNGLSIVASTSVYGDLASSIVGDLGTVTSLISDASVDPHSFEASARDQLAIADADVIIANGGGYDPFIQSLVDASGSNAVLIDAVETSGLVDEDDHAGEDGNSDDHGHIEGFNEHVWYSFDAVDDVIEAIADRAAELDPANEATFQSNADALSAQVDALETRADQLEAQIGGGDAAVTEPVPVYLLEEVGLHNDTPADFTEAIEEGNDVPPLALEDTLDLFSTGAVRLLAYNEQTASPETEQVRAAAEAAGIPVVQFTETLPEGADYVSWMTQNLDALEAALLP